SWVEPSPAGSALRVAALRSGAWSAPRTVASGADWVVHGADIPSAAVAAGETIAAHWRVRAPGGGHAYHVRVSASRDGGITWSAPVSPHADGSATEHGFVSVVPLADGFVVAWLDGRETAGGGATALMAAELRADGTVGAETILDARACDCCPTDAVRTRTAALVAYRDRSESDVRDISICRMDPETGRWEDPRTVHADGWRIAGCPVDGPALAAAGETVACAWFTLGAKGDEPQAQIALSRDGGRTFDEPLRIDLGNALGRCDLAALPDGSFLASWMEGRGEDAEIRVRRIAPGGKMDPSGVAAFTANDRASGAPRIAIAGEDVWLAWTEPGEPSRVRVVRYQTNSTPARATPTSSVSYSTER
ncbi:MAG: sialidase family protein, partial [bacterium]